MSLFGRNVEGNSLKYHRVRSVLAGVAALAIVARGMTASAEERWPYFAIGVAIFIAIAIRWLIFPLPARKSDRE